jgi:2-polyprenyl-3-methyl-5-hydroxy-6-metoxy-1,4-benzoquinol methylase
MTNPFALLHHLPPTSVLAARVEARRAEKLDAVLTAHAGVVRAGVEACERRDMEALAAASRTLLGALRSSSANGSIVSRGASRLDEWVRTERLELLDLDAVPESAKRIGMRILHWVNLTIGSYPVWQREVLEALGGLGRAHVHDLAAGTGGFALWLAEHPAPECEMRLTSSDLVASYVAIGAAAARRRGLPVAFETRNVLDLEEARGVDLFVCTQATHHLPPAVAVRMIHQAVRASDRGLLLIDLVRSLSTVAGTGVVLGSNPLFVPIMRDGVLSVRRSYTPSELTLLARLAGARHVRSRVLGAGHYAFHARGVAQGS